MRVRRHRGMGATCADYGPIPPGYVCIDSSTGNPTLVPPSFTGPGPIPSVQPLQIQVTPQGATCTGGDCAAYNAAPAPFDPTSMPVIVMVAAVLLVFGVFAGGR